MPALNRVVYETQGLTKPKNPNQSAAKIIQIIANQNLMPALNRVVYETQGLTKYTAKP